MSEKTHIFLELLIKWNKRLNLLAKSQTSILASRHLANCQQMVRFLPNNQPDQPFIDLGSGGGFPAIIIAIALNKPVIMIEKDQKKAVFLKEALRQCQLAGEVRDELCENLPYIDGEYITARAFLPLEKLIPTAQKQMAGGRVAYLLKGENIKEEISTIADKFPLQYEIFPLQDGGNLFKMQLL